MKRSTTGEVSHCGVVYVERGAEAFDILFIMLHIIVQQRVDESDRKRFLISI